MRKLWVDRMMSVPTRVRSRMDDARKSIDGQFAYVSLVLREGIRPSALMLRLDQVRRDANA